MNPPWNLEELVAKKAFLLHVDTGTVGEAETLYGPREYTSPSNKMPVNGRVLTLKTGDSFVIKDENTFVPLTDTEQLAYLALTKMVASALEIVARQATASRMPLDIFGVLAQSALNQQARAVGAMVEQSKVLRGPFGSHDSKCTVPPPGWRCTRAKGHDGPCAAVEEVTGE